MINQEKEDLAAMLTTPGWLRLVQHIQDLYGAEKMVQAYEMAAGIEDREERVNRIAQITQRVRAVRDILDWPAERLKQIAATTPVTDTGFQRGGYRA